MAALKMLDTRWCRRYRVYLAVSLLILSIHILLAYNFYAISLQDAKKSLATRENSLRNGEDIQHRQEVLPVDDDADDDDSPSNSIDRQSSKGAANNVHRASNLVGIPRQYGGLNSNVAVQVGIHSEERFVVPGNVLTNETSGLIRSRTRSGNASSGNVSSSVPPSLNLDELDFSPQCEIVGREAVAAIVRARTQRCKEEIANVTCLAQKGVLYPARLSRFCPANKGRKAGEYIGCFRDQQNARLLPGHLSKLSLNTPARCLDLCLQSGFQLAGVQYSHECFCGDEVPAAKTKLAESNCDQKCPGDESLTCGGYFHMNIYHTGLTKTYRAEVHLKADMEIPPVRVLYVLTLNGRAVRQVNRLLKNLYHTRNYYYIHVDIRQDYLYRELLPLESKFGNIRLSRRRLSTIWGGASLLQMLLQCMEDALQMTHWKWDFFINLSESDFPIKSNKELINFLTANRDKNFVKSHGKDTQRFIGKQGLDKTFYECDTRMWRIGDRQLPWGIRVDGGSDWVALSRSFCGYLVTSKDELVQGLKTVYKYTLLPAESFFHTVLRNSEFCGTYVNNNLRMTNWKRKIGCRCQYGHIVDWCGCSPNDFKPEDWNRIQSTQDHLYFFARKFEPIINQQIIDQVEAWLYGAQEHDIPGLNSHWQNEYNSMDKSPKPNDAFVTMYHSFARLSVRLFTSVRDKCGLTAGKVREATLYNENDSYQGTLVVFEASFGRQKKTIVLETQAKPRHYFSLIKPIGHAGRLKHLQVGTDYDQKEQLFRNFGSILGPFSELCVLHKWGPGAAFYATFIWIDPTNTVATSYETKIDAGPQIDSHKPALQHPLRPGVWTVKLMYTWQQVAETKFLVTPVSFINGGEISQEHVRFVHSGPGISYVNHNFTSVERLLSLTKNKRALLRQAASNAQRYGKDLLDWVDKLTSQFYVIQDTCYVGDVVPVDPGCPNLDLEPCASTRWSSLSPDPKTEIRGVDEKTGRLMR